MKLKLNKDEIKKLLDDNPCIEVWYDKQWIYPKPGDDQKTCPMLDAMFQIEYHPGYVIWLRETTK